MIPQLILIAILALGCGIHISRDGQPKTDKYSFFWALVSVGVEVGLLYWGGFFDCFLGGR